jgi:chemotaxis protein CheD
LRQAFLTPGTLYCGTGPAVISTVLGSCVSVCLVDRFNRAAGMNHFVLPFSRPGDCSLRYGDVALERLRQRMARLGCEARDLSAKVFGGATVLAFGEAGDTVGTKNVRMAIDWLRGHSIVVAGQRTGGKNGMLIRLHTASGEVLVRNITSSNADDVSRLIPRPPNFLDAPGTNVDLLSALQ